MIKIGFMGGAEDIGRSMLYLEYNGTAILVDSGMDFPQELSNFGVNRIVSYGSYIKNNLDKIKGIFITHIHEDHIGGLRRFTEKFNIPIYAERLSCLYIKSKKILKDSVKMIEIKPNSMISIDNISIRPFSTEHSSVTSLGFEIFTREGNVVITGDFKLGNSREDALLGVSKWNITKEPKILICESTNAFKDGFSTHEEDILPNLEKLIYEYRNKFLAIGTFASNMKRISNIISYAQKINKPILALGRNMEFTINFLVEQGLVSGENIKYFENFSGMVKKDTLVLSTGCQGEPTGGLYKLISNFDYIQDKTVLFSSSVIPGNEKEVNKLKAMLLKNNFSYIEDKHLYHTSGHAYRDEIRCLIESIKPKFFIPVHGDYIAQTANKVNAIESGVSEDSIIIPENNVLFKFKKEGVESSPIYDTLEYITNYGVVNERFIDNKRLMGMNGVFTYVINGRTAYFEAIGVPERCKSYKIGQSFVDFFESELANRNLGKKNLKKACEEFLNVEFKNEKQLPLINIIILKKNKRGE